MTTSNDNRAGRQSDAGRVSANQSRYSTPVFPQNQISEERLKELGPETRSTDDINRLLEGRPRIGDEIVSYDEFGNPITRAQQEAAVGLDPFGGTGDRNTTEQGFNTAGVATGEYPASSKPGFGDPTGEFPRPPYYHSNSLNHAAKSGTSSFQLSLQGSSAGCDISNATGPVAAQYPLNQVIETYSGHVIEYNDTPGSERILIKHRTGAGVEFRPDGSMAVSALGIGMTEVVNGDHKFLISGNGCIHYKGNLKLIVDGDFDLLVGGSYNVQAKDHTETYKGPHRELTYGNHTTTVRGNKALTTTKSNSEINLGDHSHFVKGNSKHAVQGTSQHSSKGEMLETSESRITKSTPDMNLAAQSMSIFGDTGTIGGENIIMYNYNMHTGHTVWAGDTLNTPTVNTERVNSTSVHGTAMYATAFNGDLTGTADRAISSALSNASSSATGTNNSDDTRATHRPTRAILNEWFNTAGGIKKVSIDIDDSLLRSIDRTIDTGGVSPSTLSPPEARAKIRESANQSNTTFREHLIGEGIISPQSAVTIPPGTGRIRDPSSGIAAPQIDITTGPDDGFRNVAPKIQYAVNRFARLSVNPNFNPANMLNINSNTRIENGISISQFVGGSGSTGKLPVNLGLIELQRIARNLIPQAQIVKKIRNDTRFFSNLFLDVAEGLYSPEEGETLVPDGYLDLRTKGRLVVYEMLGLDGIINLDKTFELADYIAKNFQYDKIILDYDTYDPSGQLNAQVAVIMPEIKADLSADFKMEVETVFNGVVQESGLFVEILPEKVEDPGEILRSQGTEQEEIIGPEDQDELT